jgi:hypothetical protein
VAGLTQLAAITKDLVINRAMVDGDDVLTWFTLSTTVVDEPFPVVNWSHLRNGRIDRIRAVFDPRALLAAG